MSLMLRAFATALGTLAWLPIWAAPASSQTATATATPTPAPNVLSRSNLVVNGTLGAGMSATYYVDYEPMYEGRDITKQPIVQGHSAPWLLRMYYASPSAAPGSIGFTWLDQTRPALEGTTSGNSSTSVPPKTGGDATDVPPGTSTSNIQQAVLSAAYPGPFAITVSNGSSTSASFQLQLFPLFNGKLEPGLTFPGSATPTPSGR